MGRQPGNRVALAGWGLGIKWVKERGRLAIYLLIYDLLLLLLSIFIIYKLSYLVNKTSHSY